MQDADITAQKQRAVGRPFPKGVSGNPSGRPKGSFSIRDRVRRYLESHPKDVQEVVLYFVKNNRELMWTMLEGSPKSSGRLEVETQDTYEPSEDAMELAKMILERRRARKSSLPENI